MASVMKKEKARVIKKGCHENQLVPGLDRKATNRVKLKQMKCVSSEDAVLVKL